MVEINMKKGRLEFASWVQPHPGGVAINCSKCANPDFTVHNCWGKALRCNKCQTQSFAVYADVSDKDSAIVREIVCISCLQATKLDLDGSIEGNILMGLQCSNEKCKGKTLLEIGAIIDRRGTLNNQSPKRIIKQ